MQHATDDLGPKLVAMPFVLVAAQLFHSVLDSILMFTGLLARQASYTWGDWAQAMAWSALGNLIGGVGLVPPPSKSPRPASPRPEQVPVPESPSPSNPAFCPRGLSHTSKHSAEAPPKPR
jgi:hypothetical protein